MKNLTITMECLRDLVASHTERVNGYEAMTNRLAPSEQQLKMLFGAFIKQSSSMKNELLQVAATWGMDEEQLEHTGRYGLAWSMIKAVFSSRMPNYPLEKCRSGENALLIAYHSVEGTEGLEHPARLLINRQKREVIAARDWIVHFAVPPIPPRHEQEVAAVS